MSNNNNASNKDKDKDNDGEEENQTMAKMAAATKKAPAAATKKAGAKIMGEDVIDIDSPPHKKRKQSATDWATSYFSTMTFKGYAVNPYSKGSKNMIDIVFHKGGVPPKSGKPVMLLNLGGKALRVEWKASECLYSEEQATAQGIQVDTTRYTGYADTLDRMH